MMEPQKFTGVCVFCYKSGKRLVKEAENFENIDKFTKFVGRYAVRNGVDNPLVEGELDELETLLKKKFESCNECKITIDEFCQLYREFKVV